MRRDTSAHTNNGARCGASGVSPHDSGPGRLRGLEFSCLGLFILTWSPWLDLLGFVSDRLSLEVVGKHWDGCCRFGDRTGETPVWNGRVVSGLTVMHHNPLNQLLVVVDCLWFGAFASVVSVTNLVHRSLHTVV